MIGSIIICYDWSFLFCIISNSIVKINIKNKDMIISSSYLIISFHPKSLQNHQKSTNFDIFRIQNVSTKILLVRNSQDLSSAINMSLWACLVTFKTQKRWFLMIFFGFFSVFVIFSKKCDDFRVTTWKYAPRPLFSRFSATRVGSYLTNRPIISADRIERPKNRTPCDFGVLSDPHLLWAGVVLFPACLFDR